jgi:hypothetical protein
LNIETPGHCTLSARVTEGQVFFSITMTALPRNRADLPWDYTAAPSLTSAYDMCLDFENVAKEKGNRRLIYARILGYLLLKLPKRASKARVSLEIRFCDSYDKLSNLGQMYYEHFLRACKQRPRFFVSPAETV